jgi:UDP-N-acetylglucosamine 2-epimerase
VFGTRPQLVKLSAVWTRLDRAFRSVLVDSGQHYDARMAGAFYAGEGIREPDVCLGVRADSPAVQIGRISEALDRTLKKLQPDAVITFGDTSTTAGAAIAASYRGIPMAHIEAGMRSFDRATPEEKNRILADQLATWRFCPTRTAVANLKNEGLCTGVAGVGDVMFESFLRHRATLRVHDSACRFGLPEGEYYFITCHRAENVDRPERLKCLFEILARLDRPAVFAVHPRARKNLIRQKLWARLQRIDHLRLTAPLTHQQTLALAASARIILTDSGGLQREAYWLRTPCLTLRDRTEWIETVHCGANRLVDLRWDRVRDAVARRWRIRTISDPYFRYRSPVARIVARLKRDLTQ